jgi:WD40 repeat protein/DNA-binding SARP family transcriptional activator
MLEIRLLGQFNLRLDDQTVEIPSRPAQSLLAFLILNAGIRHRRERLAGLLWPDIPEEDARRNLRRALWHIRKAIKEQALLQTDDISIAFEASADVWVDTFALTHPIKGDATVEDLTQSVSVYISELLPGFYDEWIVLERERLQVIFEQRMKLLLERLLEARDWDSVLQWGEYWVNQGGAAEPAYQALMQAYAGQGDQSGVARTFQRCVDTLYRVLGVEPSDETRKIYAELSKPGQLHKISDRTPPRQPRPLEAGKREIDQPDGTPVDLLPALNLKPVEQESLGKPPFKGMQYFDEEDAYLFFGREEMAAELINRLGFSGDRKHSGQNLLVIVGASGCGKSSLVRAGLVPAIREILQDEVESSKGKNQPWKIFLMTPRAHPLEVLAAGITKDTESVTAATSLMDDMQREPRSLRMVAHRLSIPFVIVIDQFEELFTQCHNENERRAFIENVLMAAEGGQCKVILTLRADFYAHCAQYDILRSALAENQVFIGPMNALEQRRAIEEPAKQAGVVFESGLVDLILHDAGSEPGALPLLSHALLETWKRRQNNTLTLSGYAESGGVHGAIARTAESVFANLTSGQQRIARSIFLRLTELGEGVSDTRRRASLHELVLRAEDRLDVEQVIDLLAEARLLTVSQEGLEVAHEALIREWPTLRSWLDEDREGLRLHRRLTEAAQSWEELECDPGELFRRARLAQAVEWATAHPEELNDLERDFLAASRVFVEQEAAERETARQREMEAIQRFAESEQQRAEEHARTAYRFRWLAAGLTVLLLTAFVMFGFAIQQRNRVDTQARLATSRELAASSLTNLTVDPERSILLSLQALRTAYTVEAEDSLHQAMQTSRLIRTFPGSNKDVKGAIASIDGKVAAWSINPDGSFLTEVWEKETGDLLYKLPGALAANFWPFPNKLATLVFDKNDKTRFTLWDANTGKEISEVKLDYGLEEAGVGNLNPNWTLMAVPMVDGTTRVYDLATGERLLTIGNPGGLKSRSLAFSPDGKSLVTTVDKTTQMFDISTGKSILTLPSIEYGTDAIKFSRSSNWLAIGMGSTVKVVDVQTGNVLFTLFGHSGYTLGIDTDQENSLIASGGSDNKTFIWDASTGKMLIVLAGHQAAVESVAFIPWQNQLVTAADDGTVRLWNISLEGKGEVAAFGSSGRPFTGIAYSPDGGRVAVSGGYQPANTFDAFTGNSLITFNGPIPNWLGSIAFSPDGKLLASSNGEESVTIWDSATGEKKHTLTKFQNRIGDLAFSPDGTRLATIGYDGLVKLWNPTSGQELLSVRVFSETVELTQNIGIDFSPDGTRFATAGDYQAKIWDARTGKELLALPQMNGRVYSVAFSPDGDRLAIGIQGGNGTSVWDANTGKKIADLTGHQDSVQAILFSRNGKQVITGSADGMVKIWDAASGTELLTLTRQPAQITGIARSPDGTRLAVSIGDGNAGIFYLNINDLIKASQKRLTRWFTPDECRVYLHIDICPSQPWR